MTTEQKLHVIDTGMRNRLPQLMEMESGCLIYDELKRLKGIILNNTTPDNMTHVYWFETDKYRTYSNEDIDKRCISLGREPMLNDVLEWLFKKMTDKITLGIKDTDLYYVNYIFKDKIWDLSKPYLKDQSKEVIDFLYKLLK